jgi:hypothetical protein
MATRISDEVRTLMVDAAVDGLDAGAGAATIKIYTGSQPADADDAASGTLLVTITMSDPAFGAGSAGVATADNTPALSAVAGASGTAGWFRAADSNDTNRIDGDVGEGSGTLNLDNTDIASGQTVTITSWTVTQPGT